MKTASAILKCKTPEELFSSKADMRIEYLSYVKCFHEAGLSPNADVLAHINELYQKGQTLTHWVAPNLVRFHTTNHTYVEGAYETAIPFELGTTYVGTKTILYLIEDKYSSMTDEVIRMSKSWKFVDDKLKKNMEGKLPVLRESYRLVDKGGVLLAFPRLPNARPLRDYVPIINRDPRHVAWILNRLYDILCYLGIIGQTHNNLSLDSVWLDGPGHKAQLQDWWYSKPLHSSLTSLPKSSFAVCPPDIKSTKRIDYRLDLALVKALGRELLGDRTGMTLVKSPTVHFLRSPSTGTAYGDYVLWEKALTDEFGPPKFHVLKGVP